MHRGEWPQEIDHLNRDKADNRIENLRDTSRNKNCQNKNPTSSSGLLGVRDEGKLFRAVIKVGQRQIHLGRFRSPREAARAYDDAAIKYFGDMANTNGKMGLLA